MSKGEGEKPDDKKKKDPYLREVVGDIEPAHKLLDSRDTTPAEKAKRRPLNN